MSESPIKRFVVLMLENRSFDNLLGWLPREGHLREVEGLTGAEYNHLDPQDAASQRFYVQRGALYEFEGVTLPKADPDKPADSLEGPLHELDATNIQLAGVETGPGSLTPARMNGFVKSFVEAQEQYAKNLPASGPGADNLKQVMACFDPRQVPAIVTLAQNFVLCDHWFADLPGPTMPNRLFVHAASSEGYTWNAFDDIFDFKTIYNSLEDAGRSWAIYYANDNLATQFSQVTALPDHQANFRDIERTFFEEAAAGTLPEYSFLIPRFIDWDGGEAGVQAANSQHAPSDVRPGEALIAKVYSALRSNPEVWRDTLLVLLYDEHGGFYDHVVPPSGAPAPAPGMIGPSEAQAAALRAEGKTPPLPFDFTRLGIRVPCLLVSPWLAPGLHRSVYSHSSLLATVKEHFGLADFLSERDRGANHFAHLLQPECLEFREDTPEYLPTVPLPPDEVLAARAERTLDAVQRELTRSSIKKLRLDREERTALLTKLEAGEMTRREAHGISARVMEQRLCKGTHTGDAEGG